MKLMKIYEDLYMRKNMPQVDEEDFDHAFNVLMDNEIGVRKDKMTVVDMKSSQKDINNEKKKEIAKSIGSNHLSTITPIIVSLDNYIVDGHHRKFAIEFLKRQNERVPVFRIMMKRDEAIAAYKEIEEQL